MRRALIAALMGGVALTGCGQEPVIGLGPGAPFPAITSFEPLESGMVEMPADGGALVVNFWASWCGPCRTEMPALQQLDSLVRSEGVRVVAVSIDRDRNLAREFIRSTQIRFPVYFDANGDYSIRMLGLRTLPETFVVDAAGIIRARFSGARDWSSPESVRLVTEHVRRHSSSDTAYRGAFSPY